MRSRNVGGSSIGSTSSVNVCFGSMADDDGGRRQLVAVLEDDACRQAAAAEDAHHARAGAHRGPALFRDLDERVGERARSAADGHAAAERMRIEAEPLQQHAAGAGRHRPDRVAEDRVRRQRRAHQIVLEPLGGQIGDGHRHPAHDAREIAPAERARAASEAQQPPPVARRDLVDRRRRRLIDVGDDAPIRWVSFRNSLHRTASAGGTRLIEPAVSTGSRWKTIDCAVLTERGQRGIGRLELEAGAIEVQRAHDVAADRAERVTERRHAEARRDLGGDRRAAGDRPLIEDQDGSLAAREIRAGDEPVQTPRR